MPHLISFTTAKFDLSKERPNPINPLAGQGVLLWLREELAKSECRSSEPDAEDWGWYMHVEFRGSSYLVGASAEAEEPRTDVDWVVQVHKRRSLREKAFGRNKLAPDDALFAFVEKIVNADDEIERVEIEKFA